MIARKKIYTIFALFVILSMVFGSVLAEDGLLFRRNVSMTPELQTEKAAIVMMDFYVPAQKSTGEQYATDTIDGGIPYLLADGVTKGYEDRYFAKPLVTVYIDGPSTHTLGADEDSAPITIEGGIVFGAMDAYSAISLDDGTTWRRTNISESADLSSLVLANGTNYPGHVHNVVHQVFGDNILLVWASKYCEGGMPLFQMTPDGLDDDPFTLSYLADLENTYGKDAVYLYDLFGVAGPQGSVDYTAQGFPEVGEIPYSCVWTARGKVLAGDDTATPTVVEAVHVMWALPERLTSGARDANLPAVDCAAAGCMLTWQEDPEGLRPGSASGPGEGWAGAIANAQTDIWYSHISWSDFDKVFQPEVSGEPVLGAISMSAYDDLVQADPTVTVKPRSYVPMAMPVRLTDNSKCRPQATLLKPSPAYCYIDFDTIDDINVTNITTLTSLTSPELGSDFCASSVWWTTPGGVIQEVCVADDGRVMLGRVASTRVRMNLKPYTRADSSKGAWIVMAAEESKALGDVLVDALGNPTDDPIDIGKDIWYFSFDPFLSGEDEMMIMQGGMLNPPAICSPWTIGASYDCEDYEFFPIQTDPLNRAPYYLTEISRRFALTTNSVSAAANSESGLSAMLILKTSIINAGGPADILLRRIIAPEGFDVTRDNPYAFENMECRDDPADPDDGWADMTWVDNMGTPLDPSDDVVKTVNPNYLQGVCLSPSISLTGNTIVSCEDTEGQILYGNDACAAEFPVADDGSIPVEVSAFPRVLEWRQCDGVTAIPGCEADNDHDDYAWENPYDVSKGHRGFLDGDYVMLLYAWSPNWKANSVGSDHYNLYVRRSFDGGETWTTTPAELGGVGVTRNEYYCVDSPNNCEPTVWTYGPGEFEQAFNASGLIGNKITVLDPRYTPTGGPKLIPTIRTNWLTENGFSFTGLPYADDAVRDPSKYFLVYETGDNETVDVGEATPLDLLYSRSSVWGDVYEYMDYEMDDDVVQRWPWVEIDQEPLSAESSMLCNQSATFMYIVWAQWQEEIYIDEYGVEHEIIFNSDMPFRRFLYLPDDSPISSIPVAYILSAPTIAFLGDTVTFMGSGMDADDPDGENNIQSYLWYSSLDGSLSSEPVFSTSTLSLGSHIISLVVTDDEGETSQAARVNVLITDGTFRVDLPFLRK